MLDEPASPFTIVTGGRSMGRQGREILRPSRTSIAISGGTDFSRDATVALGREFVPACFEGRRSGQEATGLQHMRLGCGECSRFIADPLLWKCVQMWISGAKLQHENKGGASVPRLNRDRGSLTTPPLPHHRTYGSVSGGSAD